MQKFLSYLLIIGLGAAIAGCGGQKAVEGEVDVEAVDGTAGVTPSGIDGSTSGINGDGSGSDSSTATGLAGADSSSSGLDGSSGGADGSGSGGAGGVGADGTSGDGAGGTGDDGFNEDSFSDSDLLANRVVYFQYDSKKLTAEAEAIVQAHAEYLVSAPGSQIILEGHADERGTREYNLALGEDRSKAVSDLMQAYGVSASRIQVVSYGEERPASSGYDEAAFALNRRVEILYQ